MVEQVGSLAGFAAVLGLAILSALYFSQARDLRRLREWAGRAPERAAVAPPGQGVPGRVVAQPQQPRPPAPAPAPVEKKDGDQPAVAASNGDAAPAVAGKESSEGEGDEAKDGGDSAAKPGMPAPASAAAAAAGAGAKSVTGPAAPGSAAGGGAPAPAGTGAAAASGSASAPADAPSDDKPAQPQPQPQPGPGARPPAGPQRPPGSVLPPRTGTLPPVRRLPSSNVGPAQTGVLGQAQQPEKKRRNPVYVVLAIVGVLVLGAGAAIGVPALVNGSKNDNSSGKSSKSSKSKSKTVAKKKAAPPVAPDKITVAVLNGTSIPGLAAQVGDRVDAEGFTLGTVSNASQANGQLPTSVAMYAPGHAADARRVARRLGINGGVKRVDANTQQIAGDASVVVLVGTDKTQ